jgi:hypothetical protein
MARFTLLADERFAALSARLTERVESAARALNPDTFQAALDPLMRHVISDAFSLAGAHEGTIWLVDAAEQHLMPVYNTGADAARFVGEFRQPLSRGLISLVFKNGQTLAENAVRENRQQDRTLDQSLGVETVAMLAVPFYFAKHPRGVISCVQLQKTGGASGDARGFRPDDLQRIEQLSATLTRFIDHLLVGTTVGWM